jgi:hypothetical protein
MLMRTDPAQGQKTMKDDNRSRLRHLTESLASSAQKLLQRCGQSPQRADSTAPAAGITPAFPEDELALTRPRQSFSSEMFAELLIELPGFHGKISDAYQSGDRAGLRDHVHQLLGAVVYCDAPELEAAIRALHRAIMTTDPDTIEACYARALAAINSTLSYSGYRGGT